MNILLTEYETVFMRALVRSEYGDDGDGTWEWAITPKEIPKNSRPGVIGSLVKKGVISSKEYDKGEFVIYIKNKDIQAQFVNERGENWWERDE